jgi:hypothetical protein
LSTNLFAEEQLSILNGINAFAVPKDIVTDTSEKVCACACSLNDADLRGAIPVSKQFIQQPPNAVHVLIADLHEDRAAVGEQVAGDGQASRR